MTDDPLHADLNDVQEREVQRRVPKSGVFNGVMIPVVSSGTFGLVGYQLGKWIGRMGDAKASFAGHGRFETWLKYTGAASFGLLAASVAIRHTREANKQAVELAKHSLELEQHNAALASVVTKPVGTLIETFDRSTNGMVPLVDVSEADHAGTLVSPRVREIA